MAVLGFTKAGALRGRCHCNLNARAVQDPDALAHAGVRIEAEVSSAQSEAACRCSTERSFSSVCCCTLLPAAGIWQLNDRAVT